MKRIGLLFLMCFALPAAAAVDVTGHYLDPSLIPYDQITPPAPTGTRLWYDELNSVKAMQKKLTADQLTALKAEEKMRADDLALFASDRLTPAQAPKTFALLDAVASDVRAVTARAKAYWAIQRPYKMSPKVTLYVQDLPNEAYPSGHAALAYTWASVLGQVVENNRNALQQRAASIAHRRILAGVHYPMDAEGGKELARMVLGALTASSQYQADLNAAKAEFAQLK